MKTTNAICATIVAIGSIASSARAADLFLRPAGAEGGSSMTVGVGEAAAIEIVVRLEADEELAFANIFLDVDDDNPIEALDFVPGLDVPPAVYTSHEQVLRSRFGEFPYSPGEGISIVDYALILSTGGLIGPGTFVLERIEVFGSEAGTVAISFQLEGGRAPSLFGPAPNFSEFTIAPVDFQPGFDGFVYLGIGDDRTGGAGPLTITVEQQAPPEDEEPPPPDDDNDNDNDDGISNDNGSDDPPDQDPTDNDNIADDGNENDNIAPPGDDDEPDPDDQPPDDGGANDDGTPIDPAGEDNANSSDDAPGNDNSGDEDPGDANDPPDEQPDDQPGGQDVPSDNDNTGSSSPPPATRLCGMGILPAMVSMLAALGIVRRRSSRSIG